MDTQRRGHVKTEAETSVTVMSQGAPEALAARRGEEPSSPTAFRESRSGPHLDFNFCFWNWERMSFCCSKPQSLY